MRASAIIKYICVCVVREISKYGLFDWMFVIFVLALVGACGAQVAYVVGGTEYVVVQTPDVFFVGGVPVRVVNSSTPSMQCGSGVWMDYGLSGMWTPVPWKGDGVGVEIYTNVVVLPASCGMGSQTTFVRSRMTQSVRPSHVDIQVVAGTTCSAQPFVPTAAPTLSSVIMTAVGTSHACALVAGGRVYCWGSNARCQFGTGLAGEDVVYTAQPYGWFDNFEYITANKDVTCGIRTNADAVDVVCWGMLGQTGVAPVGTNCSTYALGRYGYLITPAQPSAGPSFVSVAITESSIAVSTFSATDNGMHWYMTTLDPFFLPTTPSTAVVLDDYATVLDIDARWCGYTTYDYVAASIGFASIGFASGWLVSGDIGFGVVYYVLGSALSAYSSPLGGCGTFASDSLKLVHWYMGPAGAQICAGSTLTTVTLATTSATLCALAACPTDISSVFAAGAANVVLTVGGLQTFVPDMYVTTQRAFVSSGWVGGSVVQSGGYTDFNGVGGVSNGTGGYGKIPLFPSSGGMWRTDTGMCGQITQTSSTVYTCVLNGIVTNYSSAPWSYFAAGGGGVCVVARVTGYVICYGLIGVPGFIVSVGIPAGVQQVTVPAGGGWYGNLVPGCNVTVDDGVCYGRVHVYELDTLDIVLDVSASSVPMAYSVVCNGTTYCMTLGGCSGGNWNAGTQSFGLGTVVQVAAGTAHTCVLLGDTSVWCVGNAARCAYVLPAGKGYDTTQWNSVLGSGAAGVYSGGSVVCIVILGGTAVRCTGTTSLWHWCTANGMLFEAETGSVVVNVAVGAVTICYVEYFAGRGIYRVFCYGQNVNNYMQTGVVAGALGGGFAVYAAGSNQSTWKPTVQISDSVLASAHIEISDAPLMGRLGGPNEPDVGNVSVASSFFNYADEGCLFVVTVSGSSNVYRVFCQGTNVYGQRGYIDATPNFQSNLWFLDSSVPFIGGAAGASHTVLLTADNGLYCAGSNALGQCGHRYRNVTSDIVFVSMDSSWWSWPYMAVATTVSTPSAVIDELDDIGSWMGAGQVVGAVVIGIVVSISVVIGYVVLVWFIRRMRR